MKRLTFFKGLFIGVFASSLFWSLALVVFIRLIF